MLQIRRKMFALPFNQVYFQELKSDGRYEPEIICYTHLLKPSRKLKGQITLHIDLKQDEFTLFNSMSYKVINVLKECQHENLLISRVSEPTDGEIDEFQKFHNLNGRGKNILKISNFDVQTMKLLRDQNGLVMTKVENGQGEPMCYRMYVVGKETVMALFNDEQALHHDKTLQNVNYLLCWENVKYFCKLGYKIYDFGDFKNLPLLEELKENFGGKLVTVFSGYVSKSTFRTILLQLNLKGKKNVLDRS